MLAAKESMTEVVSLLLEAGAKVDLQDELEDSALMLAAKYCRTDIVSLLLEAGAKIDLQNKRDSALMMAVRWGRTEVVSQLIDAGANIDLQNEDGDSAVIVATTNYNLSVLKELARAGADLNLQNQEGLTALIISSRSGRSDITEILLSGDNIALDIQITNGWSALFFAVDERDAATTELLLKAGADPHLRDYNGLTALDIAAGVPSLLRVIGVGDRHRAVRRLLRSYMRKPSKLEALPAESSQDPPQQITHLRSIPNQLTHLRSLPNPWNHLKSLPNQWTHLRSLPNQQTLMNQQSLDSLRAY
ncbi:Putative ankyrin repeat protein MM_0045 [Geodia barretti]|uniref:Ankyrin repeat protein MM_0045 n=1 Tax=Geodia barretti TaxID=519541 RepID=A0AA35S0E6_GEOBA|nr:Putative ankyrin repeat protein MM_0045 [Geodia barretti]